MRLEDEGRFAPDGNSFLKPQVASLNPLSSALARSRTWSSTFAESRASATLRGQLTIQMTTASFGATPVAPKELLPTEESNLVLQLRKLPCFRHTRRAFPQYLDLESNQDLNLRRVQCDPLHHRDRFESRRLDSHQHQPVYKTGAFLSRATSAKSTGARSRTLCGCFGDSLLTQEHTGKDPSGTTRGVELIPPIPHSNTPR